MCCIQEILKTGQDINGETIYSYSKNKQYLIDYLDLVDEIEIKDIIRKIENSSQKNKG